MYGMIAGARTWLRRATGRPAADGTVSVRALLRGPSGESIVLPLLPDRGEGLGGFEFAAASVLERVALAALVRSERPARIFEIGTFRGVTALMMAANAPQGATLWTLDLPPELSPDQIARSFYSGKRTSGFRRMADAGAEREVGAVLRGYSGPCRVEQIFGDASTFDFARYHPIDLFFIDGCHAYDAARRDTLAAWRVLRPGGLLVWHDYLWRSVQKAIRDSDLGAPVTWIAETSLAFARRP